MMSREDVELQSKRNELILRPPLMEDATEIYTAVMASLGDLAPWMDWATPDYSIDMTREWLAKLQAGWEQGTSYQFTIFEAGGRMVLGGCGINHINRYYRLANLGYWVRSDRTAEGIATRAARLVAGFGFNQLGLRRIEIVTAVENHASRRVAEKAGAQFEGILRDRLRLAGENADAAMHSLLPEDLGG
jgi:ribosomal-protein-serine acetyltransferase